MFKRPRKQSIKSELLVFENVDASYGSKDERYYYNRVLKFVSLLPKGGRKTGLEIGCGTGVYTHHFAKFDNINIIGVDLSKNVLDIARTRYPRIRVEQGNIENLKYESATFDFCVGFNIVHHLPDKNRLFRNISRILKPGGIFYCEEPNSLHLIPFIVWNFSSLLGMNYTANEFPVNPYRTGKVAAKHGLKWISSFPIHPHWNEPKNLTEKTSLVVRKFLNTISLMMPYSFVNSFDIGLLFQKI